MREGFWDNGNQQVKHNDGVEEGTHDEESYQERWSHRVLEVRHLEATQNDQVGVNNCIEESINELFSVTILFVTITDSKEGISEGNDSEEKHDEEVLHVSNNQNDKSDQVTKRLEDSEEIEELKPHEEHSNSLQDSLIFLANIEVQWVYQKHC